VCACVCVSASVCGCVWGCARERERVYVCVCLCTGLTADAESVVVMATLADTFAALADNISVEPQLKPYHPNQRIIVPYSFVVEKIA